MNGQRRVSIARGAKTRIGSAHRNVLEAWADVEREADDVVCGGASGCDNLDNESKAGDLYGLPIGWIVGAPLIEFLDLARDVIRIPRD